MRIAPEPAQQAGPGAGARFLHVLIPPRVSKPKSEFRRRCLWHSVIRDGVVGKSPEGTLAARRGQGSGPMGSVPTPIDEKIELRLLDSRPQRRTLLRVRCPDGTESADRRGEGDGRSPIQRRRPTVLRGLVSHASPLAHFCWKAGLRPQRQRAVRIGRSRKAAHVRVRFPTCALPVRTSLFVDGAGRGRAYLPGAPCTSLLKGTTP